MKPTKHQEYKRGTGSRFASRFDTEILKAIQVLRKYRKTMMIMLSYCTSVGHDTFRSRTSIGKCSTGYQENISD
jgi:hypothetical protein